MKSLPVLAREATGFLAFVVHRWREDRCPQIAGSLTFTSILAMIPLLTVAAAVLSALPFFEDAMVKLKIFLLMNLVPEIAGRIITVYMGQVSEAAAGLTGVSLAALAAVAIAMLHTVDRSLNVIWRADSHRPLWVSVTGYTALLVAGPVLMVLSVGVTTWLAESSLDDGAMLESLVLRIVPTAGTTLAFFLLYRIMPNRHVPARHALAGAALAAVVFEAMKAGFASYIRAVPTYRLVYGAFASIPIFLLWLYLSWLVVLFGAEFTAALGRWRAAPAPGAREAFAIGQALGQADGRPLSLAELGERCAMPEDRVLAALEELAVAAAVERTPQGWRAARREGESPPA